MHILASDVFEKNDKANTKWILCSQKAGVKCSYLRFLIYKCIFYLKIFADEEKVGFKQEKYIVPNLI